ncbi:MAG TPA: hypothetical protein DEA97_04630 [Bacteroidales bacterium]|nr:hypothetical protein [Bacteroidales bacterium]
MLYRLFLVLLLASAYQVRATEIKLEGIFQGKNLYVMNPFASSGVGFCVYEVSVNGSVTTDEINSSAFEVDLSIFQFQPGDKLTVVIKHKDNCKPKVLNPEVLKPKSTFETVSIAVSQDGKKLTWSTSGEAGKLSFDVQQFRWNKWVKVGEVEGKGTSNENTYSIDIAPHSGKNKFRVKQTDYTKTHRYSTETEYKSLAPPVTLTKTKIDDKVEFSQETMYEIYDTYGNIVLKGTAKTVDVSSLSKGKYYLNYDNAMEEITKK